MKSLSKPFFPPNTVSWAVLILPMNHAAEKMFVWSELNCTNMTMIWSLAGAALNYDDLNAAECEVWIANNLGRIGNIWMLQWFWRMVVGHVLDCHHMYSVVFTAILWTIAHIKTSSSIFLSVYWQVMQKVDRATNWPRCNFFFVEVL